MQTMKRTIRILGVALAISVAMNVYLTIVAMKSYKDHQADMELSSKQIDNSLERVKKERQEKAALQEDQCPDEQ
jgi:hypothetical protein